MNATTPAPAKPGGLAPSIETVLAVPSMHCASCMAKVEGGLTALPGVSSARVNLTARQVRVTHDATLDARMLVAALDAVGYEAQPRSEELGPPVSAAAPLLAPLAVAAFATMNVMMLSAGIFAGAGGATREMFHWISAGIGVPAILYSGRPFFTSAWSAVRHWTTNMDVPITIGVFLATALSLYETVTGGKDAWFDGTLMLLLFLLAGRALDAMMRDRARAGVDALVRQAPQGAQVIAADGTLEWVQSSALAPGMVMRVAAGERLAADGDIVTGTSRFDRSLLTGESTPIAATVGDGVLAGTLNLETPVDVRVSAAGNDTTLAEIARLMAAAGQSRSRYVRIADRASKLYAPAVHSLAALTAVGWLIAGAGLYKSLVIAIAVLIITCPCALGLAVPVAQVVACGALMRAGIMVKDGSALERMSEVDRALFDKTGTLTLGKPLPDTADIAAMASDEASVALALASYSAHPLSRALASALVAAGHRPMALHEVHEEPGKGMAGLWLGRKVTLGRPVHAGTIATELTIEGREARLVRFSDRLRPEAPEALGRLKLLGITSSALSGDNADAVGEVAGALGIEAQSLATPAEKREAIARLQDAGARVLMIGDGLNDGPALAAAHASMAPSSASDVGRQAADLVFTGDSLMAVPRAVLAARRTMKIVRQNFALAVGYNVLAVPLAMIGKVTPLVAAIAMSTSSLIVVFNSLRLVRAAK